MINYPRLMPRAGMSSISFEPQQIDYASPETGGRIGAVAAGFPLWRMKVSLHNMDEADADVWRSFVASQRGSRRAFLAYDIQRERPRWHRESPFSDVSASWSQTITDDGDAVITLTGLLPAMVLQPVDYIGLRWDAPGAAEGSMGRYALVRAVERGVADGTGNLSVTVEPPVPTIVPSSAQAYFHRAVCLMRLLGSTQLGHQSSAGYTQEGGLIEAVQELLP